MKLPNAVVPLLMQGLLVCWTNIARADTFLPICEGEWTSLTTWLQNGVPATRAPDQRDTVIIVDYDVLVDDKCAAARVHIHPERKLRIDSGDKLTLSVDAEIDGILIIDGGSFQVDGGSATVSQAGLIVMTGDNPVLCTNSPYGVILAASQSAIMVCADATISGSGGVRGDHPDASILINCLDAGSVTLTLNQATIRGTLAIRKGLDLGQAHFHNNGLVRADATFGNTLLLDRSLDGITDTASTCASPRWRVDGNSAMRSALCIEVDAPSLLGDIHVGGVLKVDAAKIATTGNLRLNQCGQVLPVHRGAVGFGGQCQDTQANVVSPIIRNTTCLCP